MSKIILQWFWHEFGRTLRGLTGQILLFGPNSGIGGAFWTFRDDISKEPKRVVLIWFHHNISPYGSLRNKIEVLGFSQTSGKCISIFCGISGIFEHPKSKKNTKNRFQHRFCNVFAFRNAFLGFSQTKWTYWSINLTH